MIRRSVLFVTLAAVVGATLPQRAGANYDCAVGRITAVTGNSITVFDKETLTFSVDGNTRYTSWPTNGRWQAITRLDPQELYCDSSLLEVGRLVAIHPRHDGTNVARWVQVATNAPLLYDEGYREYCNLAPRYDIDKPHHDVDKPHHDVDQPRHDVDKPKHDHDNR